MALLYNDDTINLNEYFLQHIMLLQLIKKEFVLSDLGHAQSTGRHRGTEAGAVRYLAGVRDAGDWFAAARTSWLRRKV